MLLPHLHLPNLVKMPFTASHPGIIQDRGLWETWFHLSQIVTAHHQHRCRTPRVQVSPLNSLHLHFSPINGILILPKASWSPSSFFFLHTPRSVLQEVWSALPSKISKPVVQAHLAWCKNCPSGLGFPKGSLPVCLQQGSTMTRSKQKSGHIAVLHGTPVAPGFTQSKN